VISISSNSRNLYNLYLYTAKEKGGKPDRKPRPLSNGLRNSYRNLQSENSQDYAQKPRRNFKFMNSASGFTTAGCTEFTRLKNDLLLVVVAHKAAEVICDLSRCLCIKDK
jgi:hypothetical protein